MTPPNTRWDVWTAFAGPKYVHAVYDIACIAPDYEGDLSNASFVNMLFATGWWKADGYTPCDDEIRDALGWILLFEESRDPELGKRPEKDPILVPLAGWRVDKLAHAMSSGYPGYSREETEQKLQHALNNLGPRTCASINSEFCKVCTFMNVNGHSPMSLGYSSPPVVEVVKDAVYVNETEDIVAASDRYSLKLSKYAKSVQHIIKTKPADQILQSPSLLKVRKRDYIAGNDNLVVSDAVNTWLRDGIEPVEGDASEVLQFIERLIPDVPSREHILNYLAHLVQFPKIKIESALMITGRQGTGKSTLARLVSRFFGRNTKKIGGSKFTDRFQERLVECQFLHVEEAAHGGKFEAAVRGLSRDRRLLQGGALSGPPTNAPMRFPACGHMVRRQVHLQPMDG